MSRLLPLILALLAAIGIGLAARGQSPGESRTFQLAAGQLTVGVDLLWGGAVREIALSGRNFVNTHDAGRLMGASLYDGALNYPPSPADSTWGWNAVPGDKYNNPNPPLISRLEAHALYVKTRLTQWNPPGNGPVPTDIIMEQWLSLIPELTNGFKVKYRVSHEGSDYHAARIQEFPYLYPAAELKTLVTYSGNQPWQTAPVNRLDITASPAGLPLKTAAATEHWAALVDGSGVGLTIWAPEHEPAFLYTHHLGAGDFATSYIIPKVETGLPPHARREKTVYVFAGPWAQARSAIYQLRERGEPPPAEHKFVQALDTPQVYEIIGPLKHWLPTPAILAEIKPLKAPIIHVLPSELDAYHRARLLLKQGTQELYYLTESGFTRPMVNSPTVIESYGNTLSDIITVSAKELAAYPWLNLVQVPGDQRLWLIKDGQKHLIERPAALKRLELNPRRVAPINQIELNALPTGAAIK